MLFIILIAALAYGASFLLTAGILWVICWALAFTFTWKIALAVWLILVLLKSLFSVTVKTSR